jgi:hypothetical protein
MAFWSLDELDLTDSLNAEIWTRSPEEQERIQPCRDNWTIGEAGAQQAMRYPYRLPWVPDLLSLVGWAAQLATVGRFRMLLRILQRK